VAERSRSVSWQEWSGDRPQPRWPTDVGTWSRRLVERAAPAEPPVLRLGGVRLPSLGRARLYVCGITPYDTTHVGHAATFAWADLAARVLGLGGIDVEVCRNITDVDDDLLAQARARSVSWRALAAEQTYRFERDMSELGVVQPTYEPRSFDHVEDVIRLAVELLAAGAAYERHGNVYFRGGAVHARVGLERAEALELARARGGEPDDPDKDDPLDAVLWRHAVDDEPAWSSPWGPGRPGWHAECTAMAVATFGASVDVHAGGAELAFPHHAYQAAQAEAFTRVTPFSRARLHVGSVMFGGHKMAKSAGNLVFVDDLLERFGAGPLRLLLLCRRWHEEWEFSEAELDRSAGRLDELAAASRRPTRTASAAAEVVRALVDDLDVPKALEVAGEAGGEPLAELMGFLGLTQPIA